MRLVLDDLETICADGRAARIIFTDAAISPARLRQLSAGILHRKLNFRWWCFARPERTFHAEDFQLAHDAGCECIDFGLETANARLASLMGRGLNLDYTGGVFRRCSQAGIKVLVGAILRFPTETEEEALETIHFLETQRDVVHRVTINLFNLQRGTTIHQYPERYGLEVLEEKGEALRSHLRYRSSQSLTPERAAELCHDFYAPLRESGCSEQNSSISWSKDSMFSSADLSIYHLALDLAPVGTSAGVHVAVAKSQSRNKEEIFHIGKNDAVLLKLMRKPVGLNDLAKRISVSLEISRTDADVLARYQIERYVKSSMVIQCDGDHT